MKSGPRRTAQENQHSARMILLHRPSSSTTSNYTATLRRAAHYWRDANTKRLIDDHKLHCIERGVQ
jgi:hypothetical protein